MESRNPKASGIDGMERKEGGRRARGCELFLRLFGFVLTLAAAIVVGVDKQSKNVPIKIIDTLPEVYVPAHAKWHYLSALVYFLVTNVIATSYAALSLILLSARGKKGASVWIVVADVLMVALLFSGNGAAAAIGLMGYRGNEHVRWNKVCDMFGKFCNEVAVALVLSLLGSILFVLLVVFAAFRRHKRSN